MYTEEPLHSQLLTAVVLCSIVVMDSLYMYMNMNTNNVCGTVQGLRGRQLSSVSIVVMEPQSYVVFVNY